MLTVLQVEPSAGHRRDLLLLGLFSAALFLAALGARDPWNPSEPISGLIAGQLALAGVVILFSLDRIPEISGAAALTAVAAISGSFIISLVLRVSRRRPGLIPIAIDTAMTLLYMTASYSLLPASNTTKSARLWAEQVKKIVGPEDMLVSFGFTRWRAGYPFYANRPIHNYLTKQELTNFWSTEEGFLLVEGESVDEVRNLLGDISLVFEHHFGSRIAYLFTNISNKTI